jgi:hypothetical protein
VAKSFELLIEAFEVGRDFCYLAKVARLLYVFQHLDELTFPVDEAKEP